MSRANTPSASENAPSQRADATEAIAATRVALYLAAAFAAAQAAQLRDGFSHPGAFCWVTLGVLAVVALLFVESGAGILRYGIAAALVAELLWPAWAVIQSSCTDGYRAQQRWLGPFFLGTTLLAMVVPTVLRGRLIQRILNRHLVWVVAAMLTWQFVQLLTYRVGSEWANQHGFHAGKRFHLCIAVAMTGSACAMAGQRILRYVGLALTLAAFAVIGQWIIEGQRPPFFDVWFAQDRGVKHFLNGHNPYTARYEFIWDDKEAVPPGSRATKWLDGGFAYSPWTFWLDLGGHKLAGDVRYAHLACMLLTAVLLAAIGRGAMGPLIATLYLFTPRAFFILESAWTEAHVAVALAALLLVGLSRPKLSGLLLGVFLASKQYLVFAVPPAVLLVRPWGLGRAWRVAGMALVSACLISLPLIVWNWPAVWHGDVAEVRRNVGIYLHSSFASTAASGVHADALSYLVWAKENLAISLPRHTSFVVAVLALPLLIWRLPKTTAGYAATLGAVYLLFFATAKFTFCGYYYFVTACFCAAACAERSAAKGCNAANPNV